MAAAYKWTKSVESCRLTLGEMKKIFSIQFRSRHTHHLWTSNRYEYVVYCSFGMSNYLSPGLTFGHHYYKASKKRKTCLCHYRVETWLMCNAVIFCQAFYFRFFFPTDSVTVRIDRKIRFQNGCFEFYCCRYTFLNNKSWLSVCLSGAIQRFLIIITQLLITN